MSAMHWEARRRRSALDRRLARDKTQVPTTKLPSSASDSNRNTNEGNAAPEPSAPAQCPHCHGDLSTAAQLGAKIPNRYSSLQYKQQW